MVKTSYYLDTRSVSKVGDAPLKIRFTFKHKTLLVNLGIRVNPEDWNGTEIKASGAKAKRMNDFIATRFTQINAELLSLELSGELNRYSSAELKLKLEGGEPKEKKTDEGILMKRFVAYAESRKGERTRASYLSTLSRLRAFDSNFDKLTFEDFDYSYCKNFFDGFLAKTNCANARLVHYRNLRAVFNDAIAGNVTTAYPFNKFKIRPEPTKTQPLSLQELRMLRDYPVEEHQEKYRDMFMLSFYLIGMNAVDMFRLPKDAIHDGRIDYVRSKTHKKYSVKVEPEAQAIIDKYAGEKYLLNILDTRCDYRNFQHRMNDALQTIGEFRRVGLGGRKVYKPLFPEITYYWARHTWATLAMQLDLPLETVGLAMGHNASTVTEIYIRYDHRKADAANRKIIDYVNSEEEL